MAHPPPYPGKGDDTDAGSSRGSASGAPRWTSVVGIVVVVGLLLMIVILHLTGVIGPSTH